MRIISVTSALVIAAAIFAAPARGQFRHPPRGNATCAQVLRSGVVQLFVSAGRIIAQGTSFGNTSTTSVNNGRSERLTLASNDGRPSIEYEINSATESFSFHLKQGNRLLVRHALKAHDSTPAGPEVQLSQVPGEPLVLTVGSGPGQKVYRAASLWHLYLAQNELCRQHLEPLLAQVRGDWELQQKASEIEEELIRDAGSGDGTDRRHWAALVTQLGDERFSRREAADRELRQAGPALLSFLQQSDFAALDAEQQFRVRRIMRALNNDSDEDSVAQTAAWLSGDPQIWLSLMSRPDPATRQLAAAQLARLVSAPSGFDPAAPEDVRQRQIEDLRAKLPRGY